MNPIPLVQIKQRPGVLLVLLIFCAGTLYAQLNDGVKEIEDHRKEQQAKLKSKKDSPLSKEDRKKFKGLNYYPIDLKYRVSGKFVKNEAPVLFKMKTTTTRLPDYLKYGEVHFTLMGKDFVLEAYQNPDLSKQAGYEDYLFIPFTDETNGNETYEVGRYLEFRIPSSENVTLDFNQCYNPYCSYSNNFSCPIPPSANALPIPIPVGEKKYRDEAH